MEDSRILNKRISYGIAMLLILLGISIPVYGKESALSETGNLIGIGEQIRNMEEDYKYLENEIIKLFEECE